MTGVILSLTTGKKSVSFWKPPPNTRHVAFALLRAFNGINIQPPPDKVGGKALGANPRLSTRAVKLRKGNELPLPQRDKPASKWLDTAGAKVSHPAGRGREPAGRLRCGAGSGEGKGRGGEGHR